MCGLVGYAAPTPPVSRQRLVAMRDRLRHRGPDDAGVALMADAHAAVGLAHRRLSIIDTRDVGRQPMTDGEGRAWVVFNGEIYNFAALRADLETRGHRFRTRTDTEVLLRLYLERGDAALDALEGMFAFAIWDAERRRLLLARDRLGIKPLFIAERPDGGVLFASEIKALLASKVVDDAIDLQAHHDYLGLNYVPGPRTMLRGVRHLPPGHALTWTPEQGARERRYWSLRFEPGPQIGFAAAAEQVREGLQAAVTQRLVADVPLGMFLSGGIDSTAVLMCMQRAATEPVRAFTIRFEEASYDESEFARTAARAYGARHEVEVVRPDADTFLEPITEFTLDQPYADSSAIPLWYLCRLARRHVTVALGGDGGDELYAGYRTHFAWRLANIYRHLPATLRERWVPALVDRLPVSHGKVSFDLKARFFVANASRPPAEAHYGYKAFMSEEARAALYAQPPPAHLDRTVRLFEAAFGAQPFGHELDAVLYSDFLIYLPDDILVKVDRMSMAHGLEARVPFLDHRLVEAAARLPADYKLRGLTTKAVLKRALRGRAPAQLLRRRKAGFNVPMARWLSGPLRELARDMLSPARVESVGLWRPDAVTRMLDAHEQRTRDHSRSLWALLCFMLFNERFRGGRPA